MRIEIEAWKSYKKCTQVLYAGFRGVAVTMAHSEQVMLSECVLVEYTSSAREFRSLGGLLRESTIAILCSVLAC